MGDSLMETIFVLNPSVSVLNIKDAIHERLSKAASVTSCLLACKGGQASLSDQLMYGAIWAIDGYLQDIDGLYERLCDVQG